MAKKYDFEPCLILCYNFLYSVVRWTSQTFSQINLFFFFSWVKKFKLEYADNSTIFCGGKVGTQGNSGPGIKLGRWKWNWWGTEPCTVKPAFSVALVIIFLKKRDQTERSEINSRVTHDVASQEKKKEEGAAQDSSFPSPLQQRRPFLETECFNNNNNNNSSYIVTTQHNRFHSLQLDNKWNYVEFGCRKSKSRFPTKWKNYVISKGRSIDW